MRKDMTHKFSGYLTIMRISTMYWHKDVIF